MVLQLVYSVAREVVDMLVGEVDMLEEVVVLVLVH
jgi:hypothetical protein